MPRKTSEEILGEVAEQRKIIRQRGKAPWIYHEKTENPVITGKLKEKKIERTE